MQVYHAARRVSKVDVAMLTHLVDRFRTTALVGVDIGSRWLKLVELEHGVQNLEYGVGNVEY